MLSSRLSYGLAVFVLGFFSGAAALAQETPTQVLDRVNAVTSKAVLEMAFEDPVVGPFDNPPAILSRSTDSSKGFTTCQLTATSGLVCVDQYNGNPGRWVRKWNPVTADGEVPTQDPAPAPPKPYFSCEDAKLALDTSRGTESCTGITADENGGVVIAGKRKGGYNLIKVHSRDYLASLKDAAGNPAPISCSATGTWVPLDSNPNLCRKVLLPRDRPLLVDITYSSVTFADGSVCTGILGLETRTALMFFKDPDAADKDANGNALCASQWWAPILIADGKQWALDTQAKEVLQAATSVNLPADTNNPDGYSFAVVMSSLGRVRARQINSATPVTTDVKLVNANGTQNLSVPLLRTNRTQPPGLDPSRTSACLTGVAQKYGMRKSTKTDTLYITDQNFCEVTALGVAGNWSDGTPALRAAEYPPVEPLGQTSPVPVREDLVLSTKLPKSLNPLSYPVYPAAGAYPPLEPTLAPGISIDLSDCAGATGCTLVAASDGGPAATLSQVSLASSKKGMTLFQIKNIPDCRWISPPPAACAGAIVDPGNTGDPNKQFLNIAKLLPKEVTDQFPAGFFDTTKMYLSPEYRAQITPYGDNPKTSDVVEDHAPRYYFDAFFFVPQDGVTWKDAFTMELNIGALTGSELGCAAPNVGGWTTGYIPVATLLQWDVATTISEYVKVIGGPVSPLSNTDIFINTGCATTLVKSGRGSAFPYNLELNRTAYHSRAYDPPNNPPEDYFVHATVDLFYDLRSAMEYEVCRSDVQSPPTWPTRTTICSQLRSTWDTALDKLSKCVQSSNYPKQSQAINNCQSFNSQLDNFDAVLATIPVSDCNTGSTTCYDPQNRAGELKARVATVRHVYNDRLLPSVPPDTAAGPGGFRYPAYEGYGGVLPLPAWTP